MRIRTLALLAAGLAGTLAAPAAASAPTVKAKVGNFFLRPGRITVRRGTRVTWTWVGGYHNVAVVSGPVRFRSANQYHGSFSHTFTRAGTYRLECTIHPFMHETVVVR